MREDKKYQNSYLCYIDILGFSKAIKYNIKRKNHSSEGYFFKLLNILKKLPDVKNFKEHKLEITQCSDCVIISCVREKDNFFTLFDCIRRLQLNILNYGFATRGALTAGDVYHKHGYIFGPALVQAVHYEENLAINPYIICSDDVMQDIQDLKLNLIENEYISDLKSNFYYIDFFKYNYPDDNIDYSFIKDLILDGLRNAENERIRDNYICLARLFNNCKYKPITISNIACHS